jgi:hypothetical protein
MARQIPANGLVAEWHCDETAIAVAEHGEPTASARADHEILAAIAVDVDPADARPQLTELVRQERLAPVVIERRVDVRVPAEQAGGVLEQSQP